MRSNNITGLFLSLLFVVVTAAGVAVRGQPTGDEKFSAMGYLPSGAGMRMIGAGRTFSVDIYIEKYSSDADAKVLERALLEGGPEAVFKALEDMESIGKITLTGRVGFYDLKFIRSRQGEGGRTIYALTDRPINLIEAYNSSRSMDYTFGLMQLSVKSSGKKKKEKGQGTLVYAAKLKLINGNTLEIENYGISPIQLRGVQKLK